MTMEPYLWLLYARGAIVCMAFAHVDDMVVGVHSSSLARPQL